MKKLPWAAVIADSVITACCVIACINALPTAFDTPYSSDLIITAAALSALILCALIHAAEKKWPLPCLGFGLLTALYGVLMRRSIVNGAKLLWYSAARLWSLDFSFLPTPVMPEGIVSPENDVTAFLVLAAAALAIVTAVLVIKPKSPIPALLVPIPAFAGCFVYTDCRPAVYTVALLVIYCAAMLFGRELKKKDVRTAGRGRAVFLLTLLGGALLLFIISPQKNYDPIPFSQRRSFFDVFGPVRDSLFSRHNSNPKDVDLSMDGDREVNDDKAFSVNCSRRGTYLLRTHSYGRFTGKMWMGAAEYSQNWTSLEALGSTQSGSTAILRIRDAYMNERLTPYAFLAKEEVKASESYVKANGRSAYVWTFIPELYFEPAASTAAEDKYYRFALEQYTLPDGPEKERLLGIVNKMNPTLFDPLSSLYIPPSFSGEYYNIDPDQPYLTALNVAKYVRTHGEYTLTPGKTPSGKDFVEYFLTESHKGYCVHFASSTAALLQAIGIPARYVVGYRVEIDKADTWIDVPQYSAHAWTEVYIKGVGWIPVESSAGYPTGTGYSQSFVWHPADPQVTDAPADTPTPGIATPEPDITPVPTSGPTPRPTAKPNPTEEPSAPAEKTPLKWIRPAAVILAAAAAWQVVGIIIRARRKRLFNQQDSRAAVLAMMKYLEALTRYGAGVPEDSEELKLEAAFSNHPMEDKQARLLDFVRYNRKTVKKHNPLIRFILKWVTFRL